jgi:hypothetical protein
MILLLSASTIKQIVPEINNTIDNSLIENACWFVQETLIKDTLSQLFYEDLLNKWGTDSGHTGMTVAYTYLKTNYLDYILSYGVWKHLVITMSLQLNDAGLRVKTSDHSVPAESRDLSFMRDFIDNFIDAKRKTMFRYLTDPPLQTDYPYYFNGRFNDQPRKMIYDFNIGKI